MPDAHVIAYSDMNIKSPYIDDSIRVDLDKSIHHETKRKKIIKIQAIREASLLGFENVVFLDTDTFVTKDINWVFELLTRSPLGVAHDNWRNFREKGRVPFNSGVIFFKADSLMQKFFSDWQREYAVDPAVKDQVTFLRLVSQLEFEPVVLPPELNARCGNGIMLSGHAYIIHKRFSQRTLANPAALNVLLNQTTDNRVYIPSENRMVCVGKDFVSRVEAFEETPFLAELAKDFFSIKAEIVPWE